mmetsp:Transcript_135474/g.433285  ORF Transcript_135474/g.433285 Transcript_135474/m.433285 type:complete len:366 (+) Transcript_135474:382-1479(+)
MGGLASHTGVDKMPQRGPAVWAIPGLLQAAKVPQDALHLRDPEGLANHDGAAASTARQQLPDLRRPRNGAGTPQRTVAGHVQQTTASGTGSELTRSPLLHLAFLEGVDEVVDVLVSKNHALTSRQRCEPQPAARRPRVVRRDVEAIEAENLQVRLCDGLLRRGQLQRMGRDEGLAIDLRLSVQPLKAKLFIRRMLVDDEELEAVSLCLLLAAGAQGRDDEAEIELADDPHLREATLVEFKRRSFGGIAAGVELRDLVDRSARTLAGVQRGQGEGAGELHRRGSLPRRLLLHRFGRRGRLGQLGVSRRRTAARNRGLEVCHPDTDLHGAPTPRGHRRRSGAHRRRRASIGIGGVAAVAHGDVCGVL